MSELEFDENVERYEKELAEALSLCGGESSFFAQGKAEHLVRQATRHFGTLEDRRVVDVGCGIGLLHPHLIDHVGRLTGIDVAEKAVERARDRNPGVEYLAYDGRVLPFDDGVFDLAFAVCVMHHVEPSQWPLFVAELLRVVSPGGLAMVFEHNPYNPATRLVVSRCEFDKNAVLLTAALTRRLMRQAGFVDVKVHYLFFTPLRARLFRGLDRRLSWLPMGAQYCVVGRRSGQPTE